MVSWTQALKMYAQQTGKKYAIPRKGSPEYEAVKKLMGKDAPAAEPKEAPSGEGTKKGEVRKTARKAFEGTKQEAEKKADKPKRRRAAPKKAEALEAMPAVAAVGAEDKPRRLRRKKAQPDVLLGVGATERAVSKSKNPEVVLDNATNVHEPIAPPAAEGGDLAELKKAVARIRKPKALPKLVEPERVVNEKPFSFSELKKHLGLM